VTAACEAIRFFEQRNATLPVQAAPLFVKLCCRADEPMTAFRALCPVPAAQRGADSLLAPERRGYASALATLQPIASRGCYTAVLKRLSINAVDGRKARSSAVVALLDAMRSGGHTVGSNEYYLATRALLLPDAGAEAAGGADGDADGDDPALAADEDELDERHAAFEARAVKEVLEAALDGGHASGALVNLTVSRAVEGSMNLDVAAALDFAQRTAAAISVGDSTLELIARAESDVAAAAAEAAAAEAAEAAETAAAAEAEAAAEAAEATAAAEAETEGVEEEAKEA
jgi:hypothetical protein